MMNSVEQSKSEHILSLSNTFALRQTLYPDKPPPQAPILRPFVSLNTGTLILRTPRAVLTRWQRWHLPYVHIAC